MDINKLFNIDGKTALITGGSRGIGEMIAAGFLGYVAFIHENELPLQAEPGAFLSIKVTLTPRFDNS